MSKKRWISIFDHPLVKWMAAEQAAMENRPPPKEFLEWSRNKRPHGEKIIITTNPLPRDNWLCDTFRRGVDSKTEKE